LARFGRLRLSDVFHERWDGNGGQDPDDGDHNHQLDERES